MLIGSELMSASFIDATHVAVNRNATVASAHPAGASTSIPGYFKNTLFAVTLDGRMLALDGVAATAGNGVVAFDSNNQVQTVSISGDQTTHTANITVEQTVIPVVNASVFPSATPFDIQIGSELMTVTNVNTIGNMLTVTRGLDSTYKSAVSNVGGITSGAVSFTVASAAVFTNGTMIRIDNELMLIDRKSVV